MLLRDRPNSIDNPVSGAGEGGTLGDYGCWVLGCGRGGFGPQGRAHAWNEKEGNFMSRPTFAIWLISTILAVVVILMVYAGVRVPVLSDIVAGHTFEVLLLAYILMWLGTTFDGL